MEEGMAAPGSRPLQAVSTWFKGHSDSIAAVAADGSSAGSIASASADGTVRMWDAGRERAVRCFACFDQASVSDVLFGEAGTLYCAAGGHIAVCDTRAAAVVVRTTLRSKQVCDDEVQHMTSWADGVAACTDAGQVYFVDGRMEAEPLPSVSPHANVAAGIASLGPHEVVSVGADYSIAVSRCAKGQPAEIAHSGVLPAPDMAQSQILNPPMPTYAAAPPGGGVVVVGSLDGVCWGFDRELEPTAVWSTHGGTAVEGIACGVDGAVWTASKSKALEQFNLTASVPPQRGSDSGSESDCEEDSESSFSLVRPLCTRALMLPDTPTCCAWAPFAGPDAVVVGDVQGDLGFHRVPLTRAAATSCVSP
eukprot:TRINITY_DN8155_c0_g1_i1.p2 TRINITY_DN8155_c0_g1~~TRINITY_DN8155_c0_g1_i1.p2  ORF type:complete len:364 (+),score=95.15 TRINITY_DN8155_c0_g1_i1:72-1163(+)